ncbi:SIP domain-containing protein [Polymorphospora sp. NPDC051019]|uniref:SIP domain-containing protein n=1 Tax=Polymorphospora sp. NPDC051019 TaxID=3155725 RepID=UPI00341BE5F0
MVEPFPTLWLRLWIPNRNGTLVQRGCTFAGIDRSDATLTLDFVLHDVSGPAGVYAWAAGEKNLVKALRPVFVERLGLDRRQRFTRFYWIRGRAAG